MRVVSRCLQQYAWRRSDRGTPSDWGLLMERPSAMDVYTEVVLPALQERLDSAFPEFGWRRDRHGWVATDQEFTHRVFGVRADRVVAHGPVPRGFLVHGGGSVLWTAYLNGCSRPVHARYWQPRERSHEGSRAARDIGSLGDPGGVRPHGGGACRARGCRTLAAGEGEATWFLGNRMTLKATTETTGGATVCGPAAAPRRRCTSTTVRTRPSGCSTGT